MGRDRFLTTLFLMGLALAFGQVFLLTEAFGRLGEFVPLLYTQPWGSQQLAPKILLIILPIFSFFSLSLNFLVTRELLKQKERTVAYAWSAASTFLILVAARGFWLSLVATQPHLFDRLSWFLRPIFWQSFGSSFLSAALLTFPTLRLAKKIGFMDNPRTHNHPAMLLTRSVARGGALPLFLGLLLTSFFLTQNLNGKIVATFLGAGLMILLGLVDDKYDLNPYLRFSGQIVAALLVVGLGGVQIDYINHPLGQGVLPVAKYLSSLTALIWIVWTMNMISWSNGVDGQFPLIVAVAGTVIGILGLGDANQTQVSVVAFALVGASLGTLAFAWHPSKILYGFGATGIGLILASLSIINGTKIATALLVLLVPSLDALATLWRRLRAGKSPFRGDRGHLHHRLLDLGFSQRQISIFYGLSGALLGLVAVLSSGQAKLLAILAAAGLFVFLLNFINFLPDHSEKNERP